MKRFVSILLAALTLASVLAVTPAARGYNLSIPETVSAHNLEAYGLHTLNVYSADKAPVIDGEITDAEYPGPNNGRTLSSVPGDNLWMSAFTSNDANQNDYSGSLNWTGYVDDRDVPDYINSYLTYDDEYFYFGISMVIPEIRTTTDTTTGAARFGNWSVDTRVNFMQSDNIVLSHGGATGSYAQTRYNLYKVLNYDAQGIPMVQSASSVAIAKRIYTLYENSKFTTTALDAYVDELGQTWNSNVYKRDENFQYKVSIKDGEEYEGKWCVVMEGRQPLADILRITDVEYEDGTPIDYIPEWGAWGFNVRFQAKYPKSSTLPNGTVVTIRNDDTIYAQTFLPASGMAGTALYGQVSGYTLHNTVAAAVKAVHGKETATCDYLMNPVHFLGAYEEEFNYDEFYEAPAGTAVSETSRVTRTRGVLTSGVRGVNNRVIGVATKASVSTGDSLTLTIVCTAAMVLCAAGVVVVVSMKKRSVK